MIQIKVITIFWFALISNFAVSQEIGTMDEVVKKVKKSMSIFNTIKDFNFEYPKIIDDAISAGFTLKKSHKYGLLKSDLLQFVITSENKSTFSGSILIVTKFNLPYSLIGGFGVSTSNQGCDRVLLTELINKGIDFHPFKVLNTDSCFYGIRVLNNLVKTKIELLIKKDSLTEKIMPYYLSSEPTQYSYILDPKYDFRILNEKRRYTSEHIKPKLPDNLGPSFDFLKDLWRDKNFEALKFFVRTDNIIFNWFVAEFLYIHNKREKFLSPKDLKIVNNYNGKNGFAKFRKDSWLISLYL